MKWMNDDDGMKRNEEGKEIKRFDDKNKNIYKKKKTHKNKN